MQGEKILIATRSSEADILPDRFPDFLTYHKNFFIFGSIIMKNGKMDFYCFSGNSDRVQRES
jgi:hypothetical protein